MDELKNLEYLNIKADKLLINTVIITYIMVISITNRSDEGVTLETSAFLSFTVANLRFQLSC